MNTTLIGLLLMIMNTLGMNTVSTDQLEWELNEEQNIQEAKNNGMDILQPIELWYMYSNEDGTYWLDPSAEYENVIFVGYESLEEWNVSVDSLHHGNMMIGLFDETGWELLDMISEEELIEESNAANSIE